MSFSARVLHVLLFAFFICFVTLSYAEEKENIPAPPDFKEYQSKLTSEQESECGTISYYNSKNKTEIQVAFYKTKGNNVFAVISWDPQTRAWQAWVDNDTDGTMDEYYTDDRSLLARYPTSPCDILEQEK